MYSFKLRSKCLLLTSNYLYPPIPKSLIERRKKPLPKVKIRKKHTLSNVTPTVKKKGFMKDSYVTIHILKIATYD